MWIILDTAGSEATQQLCYFCVAVLHPERVWFSEFWIKPNLAGINHNSKEH